MNFIRRHWLPLLLAAALLLRLPQLFAPFWFDESWTYWIASLPISRTLAALAGDVHPPAFFVLEWLAYHIWPNPLAVRLTSLAFGMLALVMARRVMQLLNISTAGQVAGLLLLALSPFQLYYSAEARAYMALECAYLGLIIAMLRRRPALFGLLLAVTIYLHNIGWIYAGLAGLVYLWQEVHARRWRHAAAVAAAGLLALLAYLPWASVLAGQIRHMQDWWAVPPTASDIVLTFATTLFGIADGTRATLSILVGLTLMLWVISRRHSQPDERDSYRRLMLLAFGPIVISVVLSWTITPVYLARTMLGAGAVFILLLGQQLARLDWRSRVIAVALLAPPLAWSVVNDAHRAKMLDRSDVSNTCALIAARAQPGDVVYHVDVTSFVEIHQCNLSLKQYLYPVGGADGLHGGGYTRQTRNALGMQERWLEQIKYRRAWVVYDDAGETDRDQLRAILQDRDYQRVKRRYDQYQLFGVEVYLLWQSARQPRAADNRPSTAWRMD